MIFLTDCCSAFIKQKKVPAKPKADPVSEVLPNATTIRSLTRSPIGIVSITAAEDGKLADASFAGPNPAKAGSAFTVALLRLWYSETAYTSWKEFFPILKEETRKASRGRHAARAFQLNDISEELQQQPYKDLIRDTVQALVKGQAADGQWSYEGRRRPAHRYESRRHRHYCLGFAARCPQRQRGHGSC